MTWWRAAGIHRGRAALLFLVVTAAASTSWSHGPPEKRLRTDLPPGAAVPVTPPVTPADLAATAPTGAVTSGTRPLRVMSRDATVIVLADVTASEAYDEDRIRVTRLRPVRVLRGRLDEPLPGVVEMRGASARPSVLGATDRLVALLRPAPRHSYLVKALPPGFYFALVDERDGAVPAASAAEQAAIEQALADGAAIGAADDATARAARRRLAFAELGGPSPRLAADGVLELRALPELDALTAEEQQVVAGTLANRALEPATRAALLQVLGERRPAGALPALAGALTDTPAVLDALLAARARLGAPLGRAELARWLDGSDPGLRAAAVRALARLDDPQALAEVGRVATSDADLSVRTAAIEALGAGGRAAALPIVSRTFDGPEREVRQASARAMLAIGGPAADDALVQLALRGGSVETRTYATLLLIASRGREAEPVRRIAASNPSPEVRALLEHGIEFTDHHEH